MPKSWKTAKKELEKGNDRYVVDELDHCFEDVMRRVQLVDGQEPFAVVLSCADSRVVPELIFGCGLGQLFVLRVAGNISNVETIASIEYAVSALKKSVRLIIVLGHEGCGAVDAALAKPASDNGYNLNQLLHQIRPGIEGCTSSQLTKAVEKNAVYQGQQLVDNSPIIQASLKKVPVIPAVYRLKTGEVDYFDEIKAS